MTDNVQHKELFATGRMNKRTVGGGRGRREREEGEGEEGGGGGRGEGKEGEGERLKGERGRVSSHHENEEVRKRRGLTGQPTMTATPIMTTATVTTTGCRVTIMPHSSAQADRSCWMLHATLTMPL